MKEGPNIAAIATLIGDPARANMLTALMQGRALTPSELAQEAGIALSTASGHRGPCFHQSWQDPIQQLAQDRRPRALFDRGPATANRRRGARATLRRAIHDQAQASQSGT